MPIWCTSSVSVMRNGGTRMGDEENHASKTSYWDQNMLFNGSQCCERSSLAFAMSIINMLLVLLVWGGGTWTKLTSLGLCKGSKSLISSK